MEITEVRIKLIEHTEDRLRGFCSITFDDCFVVRDLKIIEGNNGPFVAMPSRKLTSNCPQCRYKNHLRASYCNQCGQRLSENRIEHDSGGRAKLYADVAHPVNAACREMIQNRVVLELERELERAAEPGYASRYDDDYFDDDPGPLASPPPESESVAPQAEQDSSPSSDSGERTRLDQGPENPQSPHKPHDGVTETSNSDDDEFGKGLFD